MKKNILRQPPYKTGNEITPESFFYLGENSKIDKEIMYMAPENISIGSNCELRKGILLDARSKHKPSIIIEDECRIKSYTSLMTYGGYIKIGKGTLIGQGTRIFGHGGVVIGEECMIGGGVSIQSVKHLSYLSDKPFKRQGFLRLPVIIKDNVAIGDNSVILPGITIESNVHVGAGSVVTKNLESGYIYVGNPARKKKKLPDSPPKGVEIYYIDR